MNQAFYGGGHYTFRRRDILPPAIKVILLLNGAMFALELLLGYIRSPLYGVLFDTRARRGLLPLYTNLSLDPVSVAYFGMFQPWQLVTYMFVHAGLLHILFNMFALWMFGAEIEERWGTRQFVAYYFVCGIGGGILQMVLPLFVNSLLPSGLHQNPLPVVGASGAVYGVLLAFGMMFPDRPLLVPLFFIPILIPARMLVILYAVISIVGGLSGGGYVAHFAHLGGMAFGYAYIRWQQHKRRFIRW
jgi:membrane associated rhomboid family serine protease